MQDTIQKTKTIEITGAIFDVDGTLLQSGCLFARFALECLRARGIAPNPGLEETLKPMVLQDVANYIRVEYGLSENVDTLSAEINARTVDFYENALLPKPGAAEFLSYLHKKGTRICVVTANERPQVEAAFARNGILEYFDHIFTCTEMGVGKEKPESFYTALELLGTEKEKTVVFDDALYALTTAKEAGFPVCGIHPGHGEDLPAVMEISDVYIRTFEGADKIFI